MKFMLGIGWLMAAAAVQASHWVPIATAPDYDPAGLYIDKDSIKGTFPVRTISEKLVNSYKEQKLSRIEVNCNRLTWRAIAVTMRSPNGALLRTTKFPDARRSAIEPGSSQDFVRRIVCKPARGIMEVQGKKHHK